MNHITEIAKMLGVELDDHFMISGQEQTKFFFEVPYGLLYSTPNGPQYRNDLLPDLILGKASIIKLPWKPKHGEIYYYVGWNNVLAVKVYKAEFNCNMKDYQCLKCGNCFKTELEATKNMNNVFTNLTKGELL